MLSEVRKTLSWALEVGCCGGGLGAAVRGGAKWGGGGRFPHCGRIPPPGRLTVVLVTGRRRPGSRSGRRSRLFTALRCVTFPVRLPGRGVSRGFTVRAGLVGLHDPGSACVDGLDVHLVREGGASRDVDNCRAPRAAPEPVVFAGAALALLEGAAACVKHLSTFRNVKSRSWASVASKLVDPQLRGGFQAFRPPPRPKCSGSLTPTRGFRYASLGTWRRWWW